MIGIPRINHKINEGDEIDCSQCRNPSNINKVSIDHHVYRGICGYCDSELYFLYDPSNN